ncbi:hypothetical protein B0H67DRAFT_551386 [Lasiosphaeris hirsuta]|uniref:Uncharacterized protein n=1 Tax=Lasiosphaeris hirsuta TaxID=260670 RepID=A0AA40E6L8_9PEZI|nr:hypothetical protein B0H67DRAFT_551386 [Lasiosphaeris hirsuta]
MIRNLRYTQGTLARAWFGAARTRTRTLTIKLHSKGGALDAPTAKVDPDCQVPVNNWSDMVVYCRSSGIGELWPALYEKAFAKWIARDDGAQHPDITQTAHGDPIKAMVQLTGREPHSSFTERRTERGLMGLPVDLVEKAGVFATEASDFKEYFAGLGVAK